MENINYIEILDKILLSKGSKDKFYEQLNNRDFNLFIDRCLPEVFESINCQPAALYGDYNVMDHILDSVEEMKNLVQGESKNLKRNLIYAMFLRDLVKPIYQEVHYVNNQRVDKFPHFVWGSAAIAERCLPKLNFNEKDILEIKNILRHSDCFDKIALEPTKNKQQLTDEYLTKLIEDLNKFGDGEELLQKIILINIADNKAFGLEENLQKIDLLHKVQEMLNSLSQQKS